jgi:hypothetical protein
MRRNSQGKMITGEDMVQRTLFGVFSSKRSPVVCPYDNVETEYCEAGCLSWQFCPVHWSHFEKSKEAH